jgi:hypothetical protein
VTPECKILLDGARDIADKFTRPDDDFVQLTTIRTPWELIAIPEWEMPPTKEQYFNRDLPNMVVRYKARWVSHIASAWSIKISEDQVASYRQGDAEKSPDRREIVNVVSVSANEIEVYSARMLRTADAPPLITEFEKWGTGDHEYYLMVPTYRALRKVAGL